MDYFIRKLRASDISDVTDIHLDAFPGFFLSFLGPRFLMEFYKSFVGEDSAIGIVAQQSDNELLGVAVGPLVPNGHFKNLLKRRWWAFIIASIRAVIETPSCIPKLVRAIRYRGDPPPGPTRALLSSVAVKKSSQGRGVGKTLVRQWVNEAQKRGAIGCFLATDCINNDKVNKFYQNLGWRIERTYYNPEKRKINRYIYDF